VNELTERFAVDGVELAWGDWGDGAPFLLCHGFSGSAHDFDLHVEPLAADRRVVTIDHRGHGRSTSTGRSADYSISRIAADVIAFADEVIGGPVDLLGHSMGGRVVLEVVLSRPDLVRSLVLMDTSAWSFQQEDPEVRGMIDGFIRSFDPARGLPDLTSMAGPEDALIAERTPAAWQEHKAAMSAAFDPYAMHALGLELWVTGASLRDRLPEITCPVTVIVGEHDHPLVDQAPALAAEVADGTLVVIDGAYHSPQLTHPDEWRAAVEAHLARVAV
jgi:pimeloyl-ACP methyl ester carboxylesterase